MRAGGGEMRGGGAAMEYLYSKMDMGVVQI